MTPSQIQRAVAEAIAQVVPSMMDGLAERILRELRQPHTIAAATPPVQQAAAEAPATAPEMARDDQPLTMGEGPGRRLTDAGRARLKELAGEGLLPGAIARELGVSRVSRGSVVLRLGEDAQPAETATARVERDLARAEKVRAYQRERLRKARAAKKQTPPASEPARAPVARTIVVVPAAEVPAPRIPPAPSALVMARHVPAVAARVAAPAPLKPQHAPKPPAPMDPAQLEPVPASYEDALDWLFAHLDREGLNTAEIEARLAQISTKQLLATCNAQRVKLGLSPYLVSERAA